MIPCILCTSKKTSDYYLNKEHHFLQCATCTTVFRHPQTWVSYSEERHRYLAHKNDVEDTGYQQFVMPLVKEILTNFRNTAEGLDYGAGTGPVVTKLLNDRGFTIRLYDPFFHPDTAVLDETYDFIICCEVMEHFHQPIKEFNRLKWLLKPNGKLFCMTSLWRGNLEGFASWWYKNDRTHTLFYTPTNLEFIQKVCKFNRLTINKNVLCFNY